MKCPKCGYNSFEYNDSCIKCSSDLKAFKQTYGLQDIVLPMHARAAKAEEFKAARQEALQAQKSAGAPADVFSFGLPASSAAKQDAKDNPFDFDDDMLTSKPKAADVFNFGDAPEAVKPANTEADFANLLEQTAHTPATTQPDTANANKPEEFNLNDFSWDDTPAPTKDEEPKKPTDDFSSLFGSAEKK